MTNDQKDAICQLWIEIFGTQEGAGYNCPQGAYDFAEVVMAYERESIAKMFDEAPKLMPYAQNAKGGCLACGFSAEYAAAVIRARGEK